MNEYCVEVPNNTDCRCVPGYTKTNPSSSCQDINECENTPCDTYIIICIYILSLNHFLVVCQYLQLLFLSGMQIAQILLEVMYVLAGAVIVAVDFPVMI